ncbi:MAG: AMP-binding protein [Deltaproteobacteria bacterium]|nr:AMP-binding protein [Deltaproteobacteria bacterium]
MTDTIATHLLRVAKSHPDRPFLQTPTETLSYSQAVIRVAGTAKRFADLGLRRGDFIACYCESQVAGLFFSLACATTGIRPAPLSPVFSVDYLISGIAGALNARAIFCDIDRTPLLVEHRCRPLCFAPAQTDVPGAEIIEETFDLQFGEALEYLERASHGIGPDDVFMILPTAGSTGTPKLVVRRHVSFTRYLKYLGQELGPGLEDGTPHRFLMVSALTHAFGYHLLTTAIGLGATLALTSKIDTEADLVEIRALDPTVLPLLPRVQRSLFRQHFAKPETELATKAQMFSASARFVCSAGGIPNYDILKYLMDQGLDIVEFYGSTEASLIAITKRGTWKPGCSGKVVDDVEVKRDPDGEILVRSAGVTPGYFGDDEATRAVITNDGYFHTGDHGELAPDRSLSIVGRKKDVFNTSEGTNIFPTRIEQMIELLPWVHQVCLVGDARPFLTALIVVKDEGNLRNPREYGFLEAASNVEVYRRAGSDLSDINLRLERIEHIVRFALFGREFPTDIYAKVSAGKIRRDRKVFNERFRAVIEMLYTSRPQPIPDPSFVPGTDRRLRMRGKDRRLAPRAGKR